jgi:hypothetical protein
MARISQKKQIEKLTKACKGAAVLCDALALLRIEKVAPPEAADAIHNHLEILGPMLDEALGR